jgi:hypothetical protein
MFSVRNLLIGYLIIDRANSCLIVDTIMESITAQTTLMFHYVIKDWSGLSHITCSDYVHPQEADVGITLSLHLPDE